MSWFVKQALATAILIAASLAWTVGAARAEVFDRDSSIVDRFPEFDAAAHLTQQELHALDDPDASVTNLTPLGFGPADGRRVCR